MKLSRAFFLHSACLMVIGVAVTMQAADDVGTRGGPDYPPSVVTWNQSESGRAFRASISHFISKVSAKEHLEYEIPKLGISMMFVAPGKFTMGGDGGEEDERPEMEVTITRGFWLGKFEITQDEWRTVLRGNQRLTKFELNPSTYVGSQRPVERISWRAASEFCQRINERERYAGRLPKGYVYRLPTEAEWEYACAVGVEGAAPLVTPDTGWYAVNAKETTHPVGQKTANRLGLYDMFGNVAEWCGDWFGKYPGKHVTDFTGPKEGDFKVARGGCAFDIAYGCRPSYRTGAEEIVRSAGIGMRLALAPEPR